MKSRCTAFARALEFICSKVEPATPNMGSRHTRSCLSRRGSGLFLATLYLTACKRQRSHHVARSLAWRFGGDRHAGLSRLCAHPPQTLLRAFHDLQRLGSNRTLCAARHRVSEGAGAPYGARHRADPRLCATDEEHRCQARRRQRRGRFHHTAGAKARRTEAARLPPERLPAISAAWC